MRKRKEEKPMRSSPKTKKMDGLEVFTKKKKRTFPKNHLFVPFRNNVHQPWPWPLKITNPAGNNGELRIEVREFL